MAGEASARAKAGNSAASISLRVAGGQLVVRTPSSIRPTAQTPIPTYPYR